MAGITYPGEVKALIIDLRFALSGKVGQISVKTGEIVKKGQLLAGLDKKLFQIQLDRQLADYEKARAEFDMFNLQKGEPQDDLTKLLKTQKQALLNASVKEVELAKEKLDQHDLVSPIEGIILDDSGLVPGVYITPSSNPIKILNTTSFFFEIKISQNDLEKFSQSLKAKVSIAGIKEDILFETKPVLADEKGFWVRASFENSSGLYLGQKGEMSLL